MRMTFSTTSRRHLATTALDRLTESDRERLGNLLAFGPLQMRESDQRLAADGWIELYEPGEPDLGIELSKSAYEIANACDALDLRLPFI